MATAPVKNCGRCEKTVETSLPKMPADYKRQVKVMTTVGKVQLINRINQINFQDGTVQVNFKHTRYDRTLTFNAKPMSCADDSLYCRWYSSASVPHVSEDYVFQSLFISYKGNFLVIEPELVSYNGNGCRFLLPEVGYELQSRNVKRHECKGINAKCIQNSIAFSGSLIDFHAKAFKIKLAADPPEKIEWINSEQPVYLTFSAREEIFYSGDCNIIRQTSGRRREEIVFEPIKHEIQRFKPREFRSSRQVLNPTPNMVFKHPFTGKMIDLKVIDLSGSGLSVRENMESAVLVTGMILHEVKLCFANSLWIKCRVQVVRNEVCEDGSGRWVKCGLVLLDIASKDHIDLMALLYQIKDRRSNICGDVDLNALWDFFFETGFIYPKKYAFIQKYKREIMETYKILYDRNPHIARHFICMEKGDITGHLAMVRFYENSWLIHHHAARKAGLSKAGLLVLDQMERVTIDSFQLNPVHLQYLMGYYRPDNKFPARVFGGAVKSINDPKGCSVDGFSYLHYRRRRINEQALSEPWHLEDSHDVDLVGLETFYNCFSGGLMLSAMDLRPGMTECSALSKEYHRLGLKKKRHLLSLKNKGELKAVLVVNLSNLGLNLSDLTNCVNIIVVDPEYLSGDILKLALDLVLKMIRKAEIPVMLFPAVYASDLGIKKEKMYNLWILNMRYSDPYFRYINRFMRFI
jgi:copper chaperone CopZ